MRADGRARGSNEEIEQRERHHQETREAEQRAVATQQCWETLKWLVKTAGVEPAASEGATLGLGPELAMTTLRGLLRDAERLGDETLADAVTVHQNQFALVMAQQGGPLSELAAGAPPATRGREEPSAAGDLDGEADQGTGRQARRAQAPTKAQSTASNWQPTGGVISYDDDTATYRGSRR